MKRTHVLAAALAAATVLLPATSSAQITDQWTFQATLYGYFPELSGQTTFGPREPGGSGVNVDASSIVANLQFAFMGSLTAQKGRWGAFTDVMYIDISADKSDHRDISIGGVPLPGGVTATTDYAIDGWLWTTALSYRFLGEPANTFDGFVGARMLDIDQTLSWSTSGNVGPIPLPGRGGKYTVSATNWDAIVGVKGRVGFGHEARWYVPYYVDVGTGESNLTWQAFGGLGYRFNWGDVFGVWRYIDYDFKSGQPVQDLSFNGPAIGVNFRW